MYQQSLASSFTTIRRPEKISFTCRMEGCIGLYQIRDGDVFVARDLGDGLYALSFAGQRDDEFAHLNAHDINRLAKMELIEEEPRCTCCDLMYTGLDGDCPVHGGEHAG